MPVFIAGKLYWLCRMTSSVNENYIWWRDLCQKLLASISRWHILSHLASIKKISNILANWR